MPFHELGANLGKHSSINGDALIADRQSTRINLQDGQEEAVFRLEADVRCRPVDGLHAVVGHGPVGRGDDAAERANQAQVVQTSSPGVEKGGVGTPDSTSGGNTVEVPHA